MNMNKRIKLFIYPEFQKKLLAYNFVILLFVNVAIILSGAIVFYRYKELGLKAGLKQNHPYFEFISAYLNDTLMTSLIIFILVSIISTFIYLKLSNKIAGPIVRLFNFFKSFDDIEKQDALRFREDDFFSDLPNSINSTLNRWGKINK